MEKFDKPYPICPICHKPVSRKVSDCVVLLDDAPETLVVYGCPKHFWPVCSDLRKRAIQNWNEFCLEKLTEKEYANLDYVMYVSVILFASLTSLLFDDYSPMISFFLSVGFYALFYKFLSKYRRKAALLIMEKNIDGFYNGDFEVLDESKTENETSTNLVKIRNVMKQLSFHMNMINTEKDKEEFYAFSDGLLSTVLKAIEFLEKNPKYDYLADEFLKYIKIFKDVVRTVADSEDCDKNNSVMNNALKILRDLTKILPELLENMKNGKSLDLNISLKALEMDTKSFVQYVEISSKTKT